jgi:choline transport protein
VPTAGGVYHWATIAGGPKWGRMVGFFTGWINFYGWMFDLAALIQITANVSVNLYVVYHQSTYVYAEWHVYVAYLLITWLCVVTVVFVNRGQYHFHFSCYRSTSFMPWNKYFMIECKNLEPIAGLTS